MYRIAMNRKKPLGPTVSSIQPVAMGPKIAPNPFRKISPAEAAAIWSRDRKSLV